MAAGVPHIGGLQQHHEEKQGPLRYDCGGGTEAPEGEEEELKEQGEYFPRRKMLPLLSFAEIISFFNIEKEV